MAPPLAFCRGMCRPGNWCELMTTSDLVFALEPSFKSRFRIRLIPFVVFGPWIACTLLLCVGISSLGKFIE